MMYERSLWIWWRTEWVGVSTYHRFVVLPIGNSRVEAWFGDSNIDRGYSASQTKIKLNVAIPGGGRTFRDGKMIQKRIVRIKYAKYDR